MNAEQPRRSRGCKGAKGTVVKTNELTAVRDLGQLALWMAATLAGMVTTALLARAPYFKKLGQSVGRKPVGEARRWKPSRARSLPMLASAIVGCSRGAVAAVFGPPRNAVVCGTYKPGEQPTHETWYYPIARGQNLAMAIEFAEDSARHVEFFKAPAVAA
jgi:hypothetical protein